MMKEVELQAAIEAYTEKHGCMPTKVCGKFTQLLPMHAFAWYGDFMGESGYITPFGMVVPELDTTAEEWDRA